MLNFQSVDIYDVVVGQKYLITCLDVFDGNFFRQTAVFVHCADVDTLAIFKFVTKDGRPLEIVPVAFGPFIVVVHKLVSVVHELKQQQSLDLVLKNVLNDPCFTCDAYLTPRSETPSNPFKSIVGVDITATATTLL
jgi:hypothetical protein